MKNLALAALITVCVASAAFAQSARVTVTQIKASGSGGKISIDPQLADLKRNLVKQFRFSKYAFLARKSSAVAVGAKATWKLSDGRFLDVTLSGVRGEAKAAKFSLVVEIYSKRGGKRKSIMTTRVTRAKGKPIIYGLGESKKLKGTLILVIKAG